MRKETREPKTVMDSARLKANMAKLPPVCYSTLPCDRSPIVVRLGVVGYFPAYLKPGQTIGSLNAELGVTKRQERAMLNGSMFGWHTPGADPDNEVNRA